MNKKIAKILALLMCAAMLFSVVGCQPTTEEPTPTEAPATEAPVATPAPTEEPAPVPAVGGQVIYGSTTEISGDWGYALWTNNAVDKNIRDMMNDYSVVVNNQGGEFIVNNSVAESVEGVDNEDGTKTFTVKLCQDLVYNNGTPITAKDYVAYLAMFMHPTAIAMGAKTTSTAAQIVGGLDYANGTATTLSGLRLVDDYTYAITITADYLPYFFDITYASLSPIYLPMWAGEGVEVADDGEGVYLTGDTSVEVMGAAIEAARWQVENRVTAGPYNLVSYDAAAKQATLEINENYKGNFEGQKPYIQKVIIVKAEDETMIDALKTGGIDLLNGLVDGDKINAALDMVATGEYGESHYERNGYGKLMFQCDFGPTQFQSVRQAVAYLLDRNEFANTFCAGYGSVVHGPYGLAMWMYQDAEEELYDKLNTYAYSYDAAIQLLVDDGWVYGVDGSDYVSGIRYKKVTAEEAGDYVHNVTLADGTILMPLIIEWSSSEGNSVSELLAVMLAQSEDVAKAGFQINQTVMTFSELLNYMYRDATQGDQYGVPTYGMYNLATNFTAAYDVSYNYTLDPDMRAQGYNSNFTLDEQLDKLSMDMVYGVASGDNEAYLKIWVDFIDRWNEYLPEIPLYSNVYYDVYFSKLQNYTPSSLWDWTSAILYAYTEVAA